MLKTIPNRLILVGIAVFSVIFFLPFLGSINLFEGFEMNFAESAREMVKTNNFFDIQSNFKPATGTSPFFIWIQALSMKIFGINEFAARFPNALCGIITMLTVYFIGARLLNRVFAIIWLLFFCSSFLPMLYFRTGTPTPWFTLFLFLSIYFAFEFFIANQKQSKYKYLILSAASLGLGILTKGLAVGLLFILIVCIYFAIKMFKVKINFVHILWFFIISGLLLSTWLIIHLIKGNSGEVSEFMKYQFVHILTLLKGRNGFFLFHIIIIFLGIFPASIFAINIFKRQLKEDREPLYEFKTLMVIAFWTIVALFTLARHNLVQYSSLCYFSLTFLASYAVYKILYSGQPLSRWIKRLISTTAFFIGFALILLYLLSRNTEYIISSGIIKDPFILGNLLANVHWSGIEIIAGLLYIIFIVSFYTLQKFSLHSKIYGTLVATIVFNYIILIVLVPHYEEYRQKAAIDFYKEKSKEDCYVVPLGFVSHASMFYTNNDWQDRKPSNKQWFLMGDIDKPVYFVAKNKANLKIREKFPQIQVINEKNGYIFLKRNVSK